jgi:hypothetical protein
VLEHELHPLLACCTSEEPVDAATGADRVVSAIAAIENTKRAESAAEVPFFDTVEPKENETTTERVSLPVFGT